MSTTVLSNNGLASMDWKQVVYNQIVQRKSDELDATSAKLQDAFESKSAYYDTKSDQYAKVKASVSNAEIAVDNGKEGVASIKDMLLQMRIVVGLYGEADTDEAKAALKTQFDDYVDQINRTADTYAPAYNPIGNVVSTDWTPNDITFTSDIAGTETSVGGTYIGSDFYIAADDGTTWVPDPGSSSITQYTVYNTQNEHDSTKADGFASTRTGLRLDSYDPDTGRITVTVDPENAATQVTGTLKTGGLGVMQSWFYDLDTEEGRAAATDAITNADNTVAAAEGQLGGMSVAVKAAGTKVDKSLTALNVDRSDAMKAQFTATYTLQVKQQQELQVLKTTFENMSKQQSYYTSIFANSGRSSIFDFTS
jgi:hypothetical protein